MADIPIAGMEANLPVSPFNIMRELSANSAKGFLEEMSLMGLSGRQRENLQENIRTHQAARGLEFGGAAVKQEADIVSRFTQHGRLTAAKTLADLTLKESMLESQIPGLLAETDRSITSAAIPQLMQPVSMLSSLYGGASAGLGGIFNLNQLY